MAAPENGRDYGSRALDKGLRVLAALNSGALLNWKGLEEVARAAEVSKNEAYGALYTLVQWGWAEKSERGWRTSGQGLIRFAVAAQEAIREESRRLGLT
jgi:DNA-binding IclR family transcriptional regulator